jgi:glycosyltransferase involved in cell wall biosynthesis
MHIVYIHQYFTTPEMAGGTRSFEMARRLVAAGHRVSMVTSCRDSDGGKDWYTTSEAGIEVHWLPVPYSNKMSYPQRIRAFLRFAVASATKAASLRGDVVFATSTPLTVAIPGIYSSWRCRVPMVFEVRDMWPAVPIAIGAIRNPIVIAGARWLERSAYRHAARIVALAPGMRDDIVASGIPATKVTVIPNGSDLDIFGRADSRVADPRTEVSWLGDRKLIVFTGTLGKVNGVEYMAEVAARVRPIDPEIRFVVIGGGAEEPFIRETARRLGVLDSTFFMLPPQKKHEVAAWVRTADMVMCLFTGPRVIWKDAVQNKFFDALAAGKPTASNFEGFQSIVAVEHDVGLILSPNDYQSAANALVGALNDQAWIKAVPEKAKRLAEGEFSRDSLAKQLTEVIVGAVAGRSAANE